MTAGPARLRAALLAWYGHTARPLPWRTTRDPYAIWISEVMLQQTQVATVIPYYERFMARFPGIEKLAAARETTVLRFWEGLGYYARARNLHRAARHCLRVYKRFPPTREAFRSLPGVGDYTAAAVWAIAFGEPVLPIDGNIRRVLARIHDLDRATTPAMREAGRTLLRNLGSRRVGALVQALMDLGALVCRPRARCADCPVARDCFAHRRGTVALRPQPKTRPVRPKLDYILARLRDEQGRLLLRRRPSGGLLGGLWDLPGGRLCAGEPREKGVRRLLREQVPQVRIRRLDPAGTVTQQYSHFIARAHLFDGRVRSRPPSSVSGARERWVAEKRLKSLALAGVTRKALRLPVAAGNARGPRGARRVRHRRPSFCHEVRSSSLEQVPQQLSRLAL